MNSFNKHIAFLLLSFTCCCGGGVYAQERGAVFKHFTEGDGLLSNNIGAIYQDKQGYIWITSQSGLQRFDGKRFKNYTANIRDTAALQSDWVSVVFEDSKNRMWVGTDHGAPYVLDRTTDKFYNFNLHTSKEHFVTGIMQFAEDKQGNIWMVATDGF